MQTSFLLIMSYLLIGRGLKYAPEFSLNTGKTLNSFVIYVSFPALVMLKINELTFSTDLFIPLILPWAVLIVSALLVRVLAGTLKWSRTVTGCLLLLIPLGNTSFFGFPMVETFFGSDALPYAVLYDQTGSFLGLVTYGTFILALFGSGETRISTKMIARKIIMFPPFLAGLIALLLHGTTYHPAMTRLLESLAVTLVPTVMIAVGYQISFRQARGYALPLSLGLILKLIIVPLLALLALRTMNLDGESVRVSVFEAGMPPMVTAGALALQADLAPELAAALVGCGIVASCATLPLLYSLL
jgi:predicted permease